MFRFPLYRNMVAQWGEFSRSNAISPPSSISDIISNLKQKQLVNPRPNIIATNTNQSTNSNNQTNGITETGDEKLVLQNHGGNLMQSVHDCAANPAYFDVFLYCENKKVVAHKLVLSAASNFFRNILTVI